MSVHTRTCASQPAPAPIPIVGMVSSRVTRSASVGGHEFEHDGERAGLLQGQGVGQQLLARVLAAALHPEAADPVHALRGQPDVAHHGHPGRWPAARPAATTRRPPSSLTAWAPPSLISRSAEVERLLGRGLVGPERQVADDHRPLRRAHHGPRQRQQVIEPHRHGRLVAEHVVAGGVADEQHRDAGLVEDLGAEHVVGRQHPPAFAAFLCCLQVAHRHAPGADPAVEGRHRGRVGTRSDGLRGAGGSAAWRRYRSWW